MAQKRKRNKSKKWISRFAILILLVVAAAVAYLVWDSYFKVNDKKMDDEQQIFRQIEEEEKVEERPEEVIPENKEEELSRDEEKKVVQYEGEDPNKSESLSGVVTYAGVSGDKLMIRVNIDQFLNSGECALSLVRGGATIYSDITSVVGSVATATCEGFDVPVEQIGSGSVEIKIVVRAGEKTGAIYGRVEL